MSANAATEAPTGTCSKHPITPRPDICGDCRPTTTNQEEATR